MIKQFIFILFFLSVGALLGLDNSGYKTTYYDEYTIVESTKSLTWNPQTDTYYEVGADGDEIILYNNSTSVDPTYQEMIDFLKLDRTDLIAYNDDTFVCADFAEVVHNNAEALGIKAYWVGIDLANDEFGHAINAFNTTDKGMIYIDCTGTEIDTGHNDCIAYLQLYSTYGIEYIYTNEEYTIDNDVWIEYGVVTGIVVFE